MALPEPPIDTRNYRDILAEALARIPVHNPEWTNFNDADPGITLLQLFAFMSESIIYRANRIPERNRRKFLRLLGECPRPAEPARGLVVFDNPRGPLQNVLLADDQELLSGQIPFRTLNALQVLPIEARMYYKQRLTGIREQEAAAIYRRVFASFEVPGQRLGYYETRPFAAPVAGATLPVLDLNETVDGMVWLALLARPNDDPAAARQVIANQVLTLGILPALGAEGLVLPAGNEQTETGPGLRFEVPNTDTEQARYRPLAARTETDLLRRPGLVELTLPEESQLSFWDDLDPLETGTGAYPPSLEETGDQQRLISWIRMCPAGNNGAGSQLDARFSWLGINAAQVIQQAQVPAERLPDGTGEPDQSASLSNTPVILDSVRLSVNGELWQRVDDLNAAGAEVATRSPRLAAEAEALAEQPSKAFTLDRDSGEIRFGNGIHGTRPPRGARIQAAYAYGGGSEGVVGIGAINKATALPSGLRLSNPVPSYGGARAETLAEAEQRIPAFLRHRERLVTAEDVREIANLTPGVELGRIEVLPLLHPGQPEQLSAGLLTVMVIPASDPVQPEAPLPDRLFLETVCRYLTPRRLITTEIHVRGPDYRDIWASVGIDVVPGREQAPVRDAVSSAIRDFLSPLKGGFEGKGWPLNKAVEVGEIAAAATRVNGVAKVSQLHLGNESGADVPQVGMRGLQLPRLRALAVATDEPPSLDELRGQTEADKPTLEGAADRVVPVPIIPEEC